LLEAINLKGARGDRCLFHSLNFQLNVGDCLMVQGENGSGKTNLLRTLVGFTPPADGAVHWNGRQIKQLDDEYRRMLLYCGHHLGLKEGLSATENLVFGSTLADAPVNSDDVYDALHQVGLQGKEQQPLRTLSQGQRRRVNLARLLLQKRALWVLDEPLTALDAKASQWVIEAIDRHLDKGGMVVLTTHQDLALAHPMQLIRVGT